MSSSERRAFLAALALLPVAACGFTPAYGPHGAARALRGRVRTEAPTDRDGFDLAADIEDRLGATTDPAYELGYRITVQSAGVAVTPENVTTRYNLIGTVAYTLKDIATGKLLTEGTVSDFTAYSAVGTTVSTLAAQTDARARLMRILADHLVTQLIAGAGRYLPQTPASGSPATP